MQLFKHFSEEERFAVLRDLCAVTKHYQKGETVLHAGSENRYIFTVLSGSVKIQNNDIWGNTSVLNMVEKIIKTIPVYHLSCNISDEAVTTVYEAIKENFNEN